MFRKITLLLICWLSVFCTRAQEVEFEIVGTIDRLKHSDSILLSIDDTIVGSVINSDGNFYIKGKAKNAQEASIRTDSSNNEHLWIENGLIKIKLAEESNSYSKKHALLKITDFSGPDDSYLYFYKTKALLSQKIRSTSPAEADSLFKISVYSFIDSVMMVRPNSGVIPHYIRFFSKLMGDQFTGKLFTRLSFSQQNSKDGVRISNFLIQRSLVKTGMILQDFSLIDSKGNEFNLYSTDSEYLLLDFWASYCAPCRINHSDLKEVYEKYKKNGLEIVSISLDTEKKKWLKAIKEDKLIWINVSDLKGNLGLLSQKYNIQGIPFSILLDKNKKIVAIDLRDQNLSFFLNSQLGK